MLLHISGYTCNEMLCGRAVKLWISCVIILWLVEHLTSFITAVESTAELDRRLKPLSHSPALLTHTHSDIIYTCTPHTHPMSSPVFSVEENYNHRCGLSLSAVVSLKSGSCLQSILHVCVCVCVREREHRSGSWCPGVKKMVQHVYNT